MASDSTVTTCIFRTVRPEGTSAFEELARSASKTIASYSGYLGTDVITPPPGERIYAIVIRFADAAALHAWERSPERTTLIAALDALCEPTTQSSIATGMEGWFSAPGLARQAPPRWKSAVVSFVGAYPTILVLNAFVTPHLGALPAFARAIVLGALICLTLTYALMPLLARWLGRWLYAR